VARHVVSDVPYLYQGSVPSCHETSLRMILSFHGLNCSSSYIRNLSGFNYGFKYFKENHFAVACAESPMGPWPHMAYAAEKMGCSVDLIRGKSWETTWPLIREYLDKDVPLYMPLLNMKYLWKTTFPVPHVVLLCGYDEEKGVVMLHDPALGEVGEGIPSLPRQYVPIEERQEGEPYIGMSGAYAEFRIEDFEKACDLAGTPWQPFWKNGVAIISPTSGRSTVSWAEVIDRNGKLTLGLMAEVAGEEVGAADTYGPAGLENLADDLGSCFGLPGKPKAIRAILGLLRGMTFHVGADYKKDAQAFLAGMAGITKDRDLEEASFHLRFTANCFEQGLAEIDQVLEKEPASQDAVFRTLDRIAGLLRHAAESERRAGSSLRQAAGAMK
jgi:hypothetical protein